jgi:hypothetical protein
MLSKPMIFLILTVASVQCRILDFGDRNLDFGDPVGVSRIPEPKLRPSYDYIVVGAGSSG